MFVGRDMTERMKLEPSCVTRRSSKRSVSWPAASHDFNNILTVITGSTDVLFATCEHDPQLRGLAKPIDDAAERAADLTQRLLAFARKHGIAVPYARSQRGRAAT